jgi:hypothetical protein
MEPYALQAVRHPLGTDGTVAAACGMDPREGLGSWCSLRRGSSGGPGGGVRASLWLGMSCCGPPSWDHGTIGRGTHWVHIFVFIYYSKCLWQVSAFGPKRWRLGDADVFVGGVCDLSASVFCGCLEIALRHYYLLELHFQRSCITNTFVFRVLSD